MRENIDLLLSGGTVLTLDSNDTTIEDGAVAIHGNRIRDVGSAAALDARYRAQRTLACRDQLILPGLIDTYTHTGHGLIRGLFHPKQGWPARDLYWHATTPEWWHAEALLASLERTRFGVTTAVAIVGATPPRVDDAIYSLEVAQAYATSGLRVIIGVGPPDPIFPHLDEPWKGTRLGLGENEDRRFTYEDALETSLDVIRQLHGTENERVQACLAPPYLLGRHVVHGRQAQRLPTSIDAPVIARQAERLRGHADALGVVLHTHMFHGSVSFCLEELGAAFVEEILGPDVVAAHANGMTPQEIEVLGSRQCGIAVVPSTHENLWYGFAPTADLVAAGARVSIATDGAAPYCSLDVLRQLAPATWNSWHLQASQDQLAPSRVLRMVTIDAARALGLDSEIGSLEPGKKADLITIDLAAPHFIPVTALEYQMVHYAAGQDVLTVIVDGEVLMQDRNFELLDAEAIRSQAEHEASAAFARFDVSAFRWDRSDRDRSPSGAEGST